MTRKDKTKDLFYNAIDYLVMLVIIIGVVIILGWKFEMLFNKSTTDDTTVVENNTEEDVKPTESDTGKKDISEVDKIDKNNQKIMKIRIQIRMKQMFQHQMKTTTQILIQTLIQIQLMKTIHQIQIMKPIQINRMKPNKPKQNLLKMQAVKLQ